MMDERLQQLEDWFKHGVKTTGRLNWKISDGNKIIASNTSETSEDSALDVITRTLIQLSHNSIRRRSVVVWVGLAGKGSTTGAYNMDFLIEPFGSRNAISGGPQTNPNQSQIAGYSPSIGEILKLQEEKTKLAIEKGEDRIERTIADLKKDADHKAELDDLRGEIYAIKDERSAKWEKVLDALTQRGLSLDSVVAGVFGLLSGNGAAIAELGSMTGNPVDPNIEQEGMEGEIENEGNQEMQDNQEQAASQEENRGVLNFNLPMQAINILASSGVRNPDQVLFRVALYVQQNPAMKDVLLGQLPPMPKM